MSVMSVPAQKPQVGEPAPDIRVVRADDGSAFALSQLWQDGPAVLVFLRHLNCMFCREQVAQLYRDKERFAEAGAVVALITFRPAAEAAAFCTSRGVDDSFVCLSDPETAAYQAYGLARGTHAEVFNAHVAARGLRALLQGHLAGMPKGDAYQMPGVFIVDRQGILRYAHRHKDIADNPTNYAMLNVLDTLPASPRLEYEAGV
jgi:peroxiredoxin